jgi:predicted RNA-binding protein YlxR (DUF448 family)
VDGVLKGRTTSKMVRRKHVPQRTCIACRQVGDKRGLIRIVRSIDAGVLVDPTGKRAGRGAYLCRIRHCWEQALAPSSRLLDRALRTTLTESERHTLRAFMETLNEERGQKN